MNNPSNHADAPWRATIELPDMPRRQVDALLKYVDEVAAQQLIAIWWNRGRGAWLSAQQTAEWDGRLMLERGAAVYLHCADALRNRLLRAEECTSLAEAWRNAARLNYTSADREPDPGHRRGWNYCAACYMQCQETLTNLIETGSLPSSILEKPRN